LSQPIYRLLYPTLKVYRWVDIAFFHLLLPHPPEVYPTFVEKLLLPGAQQSDNVAQLLGCQ